jgi:nuclear pore complex protein Nup93
VDILTIFLCFCRHYLLAASGISPGRALRDLKTLDSQATSASPLKQPDTFDPNNEKFLRGIQQRGRQAMVAESLARVHRDFDAFLEDQISLNWDEQRQKIYEHFGLAQKEDGAGEGFGASATGAFGRTTKQGKGPTPSRGATAGGTRSVFGRSGLEKSVIGPPGNGLSSSQIFSRSTDGGEAASIQSPDTRFLREKMGYFAEKVQRLNEARLQERPFPVLHEFSQIEEHAGGDVRNKNFSMRW